MAGGVALQEASPARAVLATAGQLNALSKRAHQQGLIALALPLNTSFLQGDGEGLRLDQAPT
jgi:hypothetical protein